MAIEIDAHQHFWQLSQPFRYGWLDAPALAPIKRDFLPEHLEALMQQTPIKRSVFVQTQHDTSRRIAGRSAWRSVSRSSASSAGCTSQPGLRGQLLEFKDHPLRRRSPCHAG